VLGAAVVVARSCCGRAGRVPLAVAPLLHPVMRRPPERKRRHRSAPRRRHHKSPSPFTCPQTATAPRHEAHASRAPPLPSRPASAPQVLLERLNRPTGVRERSQLLRSAGHSGLATSWRYDEDGGQISPLPRREIGRRSRGPLPRHRWMCRPNVYAGGNSDDYARSL